MVLAVLVMLLLKLLMVIAVVDAHDVVAVAVAVHFVAIRCGRGTVNVAVERLLMLQLGLVVAQRGGRGRLGAVSYAFY